MQTLRRCLSQDRSPAAVAALGHALDTTDWKGLVDLANRHFLTPALWWALEEKGLAGRLPGDLREFLRRAHSLNLARNEGIRAQAGEIATTLDRSGIVPIVLKGGVHLFEDAGALGVLGQPSEIVT